MAQDRHVHDHDDVSGLLSVEDARRNVLAQIHPLASLQLPLTEAYGCVAAEDVVAERDLPEFASSAMDGFAVRSSDVAGATPASPIELKIVGSARIGRRPDAVVGGGEAVRIATGAPIPAGADTVVPIENAEPRRRDGDDLRRPAVRTAHPSLRRGREGGPGPGPGGQAPRAAGDGTPGERRASPIPTSIHDRA